jgi:asparagine synthase (glutamine-hydrolysing)
MSGIFGIFESGSQLSTAMLTPMLRASALEGESEQETGAGNSFAMGVSRRWKFQQLASVGGITVVADADLVDLPSLAGVLNVELGAASQMPVAELTARLYIKEGADFLTRLNGAFSIALWDEREERLLLAIDPLGIKSLYWRRDGRRLLFASRLSAIRSLQGSASEVNSTAVLQFLLFAAVPAPMTSDRGTEKLRPGTSLLVSASRVQEHQYWDLEYQEDKNPGVARWSEALRDAMRSAVHRHLEGCDPNATGCYLSGGTDSSSVVAFASEKHKPTQTFSIAFEEARYSEIEFARTSARTFHSKHFEKFLVPQDAPNAIEKIIAQFDEPFANSSAIGSYYCALFAAQQGVHTLLAGDGGDELFGGNERYQQDKYFSIYHLLPSWLRSGLIKPLVGVLPLNDGKLSLPRKYVRRAEIPNPRRILSYGFFLSHPQDEIFTGEFLEKVGRENWLTVPEQHFARAKASNELNRILYLDIKMTLADNDLRKVSGTAELAGVNVRYPLLDKHLAEFSGRIPASLKLKGFQKRYLFKQAMKGILPEKVLYKKKHGFGVPLAQWLLQEPHMNELMKDLMSDSRTRQRGYFQPKFFDHLMKLHVEQPSFSGEIVWYLLALELWHRKHMDHAREGVHAL